MRQQFILLHNNHVNPYKPYSVGKFIENIITKCIPVASIVQAHPALIDSPTPCPRRCREAHCVCAQEWQRDPHRRDKRTGLRNITNQLVGFSGRRYVTLCQSDFRWYWRFSPLSSMHLKPPPPGQKRQKEEWENYWYIGMFGGMLFAAVGMYYKPDTRYASIHHVELVCVDHLWSNSIHNWALKEAKRRMEEKGESVEYKPS